MQVFSFIVERFKIVCIALAILCYTSVDNAYGEEIDVASTVKNIRNGIEQLAAQERSISCLEINQDVYLDVGTKAGSALLKVHRSDNKIMMIVRQIRIIRNASEQFSVKQAKRSDGWLLSHYHKTKSDTVWKGMVGDTHLATYPLTALTSTWTIDHIVNDTTFKPKTAKQISPTRIELEYEVTTTEAGSPSNSAIIITGKITFAKDLNWLPVRSVTTTSNNIVGTITTTLERDANVLDNTIVVKSASFSCGEPKSQFYNKSVFTYRLVADAKMNPDEFNLDFYKIAAPEDSDVFEDKPPFNWVLWISLGFVCIVSSVVLAIGVRRRLRS